METKSPHIGWFDRLMAAITFAEAGEVRTALEVRGMDVERKSPRISKFDRLMTAIAFAEAGEAETALDISGHRPRETKQKRQRRKVQTRIDNRPRLHA
jgi:hypothetical protein